jgi:hypothetical protein
MLFSSKKKIALFAAALTMAFGTHAFPNGRRPGDDVTDSILTIVNNRVTQRDNVNANDAPFRNTFPFFALPNQAFPAGAIDDGTRN